MSAARLALDLVGTGAVRCPPGPRPGNGGGMGRTRNGATEDPGRQPQDARGALCKGAVGT